MNVPARPPVFATLGCRLNAYETEAMKEMAAEAGVGKSQVVRDIVAGGRRNGFSHLSVEGDRVDAAFLARLKRDVAAKQAECLGWRVRKGLAAQDEGAGQAETGSCRGGLAGVVGLGRAAGDQGVGPLGQRLGDEKLQFAGLVPARRQPGLVVPLDPQLGAAQMGGQTGQELQRGRQMSDGDSGLSVG